VTIKPVKLLKKKSGRPGSNRRRPAWENGRRLNLNNNRAYGMDFWLKKSLQFSVFEIRAPLNGIQTGYSFFLEFAEVRIQEEETL